MERVRKRARILLEKAGINERGLGTESEGWKWDRGEIFSEDGVLTRQLRCEGVL